MRNLPPLNALRAFEAAARNGSFTQAAQELLVSQGAVSRHVAKLEDWLGIKLFVRGQRGIELTSRGARYYQTMRLVFDQIDQDTRRLQNDRHEMLLRLKMPPTFAVRWLVPRLARFHALNREIDVQVTTSHQTIDFSRDEIDVCIQWSGRKQPSGHIAYLFGETLLPVCSPRFLKRIGGLQDPACLADHVLLCSLHRPSDWSLWLEAVGVPHIDCNSGPKFENSTLAYQAAIDELGIVMAQMAFIEEDLRVGRLVAPFDLPVKTNGGYIFAYPTSRPKPEGVRLFEAWILQEAAQTGNMEERLHGETVGVGS